MDEKQHFSLARVQNLTDGIFAVAMTLLVLDIRLAPGVTRDTLLPGLFALIPGLYSYVVSFFILALFWWIYHRMMAAFSHADNPFVWWNVGFLFLVTLLPFSAHLLGQMWGTRIATEVYCVHLVLLAIMELVMWRYGRRHALLSDRLNEREQGQVSARLAGTIGSYVCAAIVGYFFPTWFWLGFFAAAVTQPIAARIAGRI